MIVANNQVGVDNDWRVINANLIYFTTTLMLSFVRRILMFSPVTTCLGDLITSPLSFIAMA
ncbi:hypothetical protein PN838_09025 [Psychrosphaera sp. G1-22]|uniref:Uncharacterized protein n=1 Tax=Psychrosphaera algicola TaxID=3023714 RepID=A0ABT5FBG3_9GAMM|nr:hypothetical protein [Psychrosphaera sp. G1-22]MDC2888888.1 hypothetical protein [Psychrosphaera sp. G1-22]